MDRRRTADGGRGPSPTSGRAPGTRRPSFHYTTRGCFRNPTRDRGRLIGIARVASAPRQTSRPVSFGGRAFPIEIKLRIDCLAELGRGVELAPLVERLTSFPNKKAWAVYLRRALVPLAEDDAALLETALDSVCGTYSKAALSYVR
jgi:hypothetical protein